MLQTMEKGGVLLVGNFLSQTVGVPSIGESLALRLREAGWLIITTSDKTSRIARLADMLATTWGARNRYAIAQVDVFSGKAFVWAEAVCRVLRWVGKPYILTLHGGNLPQFAKDHPQRISRLLASAAIVTTPSSFLQEGMASYGASLQLLPNPLDLNQYVYRHRSKPRPHLIWLRAFHQVYNPSLAPRVMVQLAVEHPGIHLTMVGPDKGDGSLQEMWKTAASLGVTQRINCPGGVPKEQVPVWLNQGDIFLNTTRVDNTPVSILEAMACGMCVVSTSVGGIPYLLEHEQDALLVPSDDPEAMANAVHRLLKEPGLADRLSRNARRKVASFDWANILPQWESLLNQAIQYG